MPALKLHNDNINISCLRFGNTDGKPFVIGGNSIGVRTLDLNRDFEAIKQQLDDIVREFLSN